MNNHEKMPRQSSVSSAISRIVHEISKKMVVSKEQHDIDRGYNIPLPDDIPGIASYLGGEVGKPKVSDGEVTKQEKRAAYEGGELLVGMITVSKVAEPNPNLLYGRMNRELPQLQEGEQA